MSGSDEWSEVKQARPTLAGADPEREVEIPLRPGLVLPGTLRWSGKPRGVVVFAHGSGSSRHSPRNQYVSSVLVEAGLATLLFDLLSEWESTDRSKVFDIELLADRVVQAATWVVQQPEVTGLRVGLFGASTGSAAALLAAASHPSLIAAVVSRGGRPDLAWNDLPLVQAPTLLIVGGQDEPVLTWNQQAYEQLTCPKDLVVIPGATHLFEEPGALEQVAELARDWFLRYLPSVAPGSSNEPTPNVGSWL
ncbi:MAG: dienelactone hydrolase family protein [Gemmataceae bacterium]|nr:dienelactone hydrolase family protein [Gemmataceae bacterium]MCS7270809.1 dienelactone hydrolase family protein [Gemmataceae bacterium]MDW8243925.1 dienelactone hydrolase family protein [Thermogemmata sp.]